MESIFVVWSWLQVLGVDISSAVSLTVDDFLNDGCPSSLSRCTNAAQSPWIFKDEDHIVSKVFSIAMPYPISAASWWKACYCNLDHFLEFTIPTVPLQHMHKALAMKPYCDSRCCCVIASSLINRNNYWFHRHSWKYGGILKSNPGPSLVLWLTNWPHRSTLTQTKYLKANKRRSKGFMNYLKIFSLREEIFLIGWISGESKIVSETLWSTCNKMQTLRFSCIRWTYDPETIESLELMKVEPCEGWTSFLQSPQKIISTTESDLILTRISGSTAIIRRHKSFS